jgi:NADP-dependent 3-hydroxy acid dehydrogenase YdfG
MEQGVGARLVIITGASSGIGAATAREFAAMGHPLLLLARRRDRMEALALPNAVCAEVDVTDRRAVAGAISHAVEAFGPPDLLVNNAGIMPLGSIRDQDPAEWQQLFDVNCVSLLEVTQEVLPHMLDAGRGTIVNVGSVAGRNVYPNHMAYCGTKFAVHAISEQMRKELASTNIRVAVIAPGMVETELLDGTTSDTIKSDYISYKEEIGGAIGAEHVAKSIAVTYQMPQEVCIREIVLAPTRQDA